MAAGADADLDLVVQCASAQLRFAASIAQGMMSPLPYAARIAKAVTVLAMGFLTGEERARRARFGDEVKQAHQQTVKRSPASTPSRAASARALARAGNYARARPRPMRCLGAKQSNTWSR